MFYSGVYGYFTDVFIIKSPLFWGLNFFAKNITFSYFYYVVYSDSFRSVFSFVN
nr:MAG TPA: hypothetical protein [Caudoviricetes sp.]